MCNAVEQWHRGGAAQAVSSVAAVRGLRSSNPSATSCATAPRDSNVAPAQDAQTTS